MSVIIDKSKCIGCGACAEDCVSGCLAIRDGGAVLETDGCILCGHCVAICPAEAISIPECRMDLVEELLPADMKEDPVHLQRFLSGSRSIRRYRPIPVEREKLEAILETGRMSPTAGNRQNLRFVVLQKRLPELRVLAVEALYRNAKDIAARLGTDRYISTLTRMHEELLCGRDRLFFGAPAVIVVVERGGDAVNGALAASRMALMAQALDVGVCFNGFFSSAAELEPRIREMLGLGAADRIALTFVVGYPDVTYLRTAPRRKLRADWL